MTPTHSHFVRSLLLTSFSSLTLTSSLLSEELLDAKLEFHPEIAICKVAPNPSGNITQLIEMEANEESIQSVLQNEETKTTLDKLKAPILLHSMEDALKHLNRASMEKIADLVDFEKQQVAIFAWQGSGQDRLGGHLASAKGAKANFHYTPGKTRDLRTHSSIFAMPKDVEIKVHQLEHRIIRCGVGLEKIPELNQPKAQLEVKPGQKLQLEIKPEPGIHRLELQVQPAPKAE